jgi:hypothetical protein
MGDDVNRLCAIVLAVLVLGTGGLLAPAAGGLAHGAEKGKAKARKSGGKAPRSKKPAPPRATTPDPASDPPPAADPDRPAATTTAAADTSAASSGTRAGKPRVYTFGGLDLEGKLRTPQLLYFRGRMRQELDASSLQRRSFLKELEKTADDQGL